MKNAMISKSNVVKDKVVLLDSIFRAKSLNEKLINTLKFHLL